MSAESSTPAIATQSEGPVPNIGGAASTPLATQSDDRRQDGQFVMLETPERLEEFFSWRRAAITSAAPIKYYDAGMSGSSYKSKHGDLPLPQTKLQEVPTTSYHNTTSVSCDTLKANKLTENGNDSSKREDLILKVLKTEDLLT